MATVRSRTMLRRLLLAAAVGGAAAAVVAALALRPDPPHPAPSEGWHVRGLRKTRWEGNVPVVRVVADEARLERERFGPFRIGFARRLVVRGATIELLAARPAPAPSVTAREGRPVAPGASARGAITSVRVDGLALRVRRPGAPPLELRAARCEATALGRAEVVCRGGVRLTSGRAARRFPELRWDVRAGRFLADDVEELTAAVAALLPHLRALVPSLATGPS
jgi:hypothetical protein